METYTENVRSRMGTIRLRTWTLSITTLVLLVFYIFVTLGLKSHLDPIDFAITVAIQLSTHFAYFPDGERYGATDITFISARSSYNTNATRITKESTIKDLREFCTVDYEERKAQWLIDSCGALGISIEEYGILRQKSREELRGMKQFENGGKLILFSKRRRRALLKLIYGGCPVKTNAPEKILSAVDRDYAEAIKDRSKSYRQSSHAIQLVKSIVVGGILGYIGYSLRDGLSFAAIMKSAVFVGAMIFTAVLSYIAGEKSTREYKKDYYLELSVFIDRFFSWVGKPASPEKEEE